MTSIFYHSKKVSDYTTRLGELCPDPYEYEIRAGDSVVIVNKVFGFSFNSLGTVIKVIKHLDPVKEIMRKAREEHCDIDKENWDIIVGLYPLCGQWGLEKQLFDTARSCIVAINEKVSVTTRVKSWIKKNYPNVDIRALSNPDVACVEFNFEGLEIRLERIEENYFDATIRVRSLLDGSSVHSTKVMDNYNKKFIEKHVVENVAWSDEIIPRNLLDQINEVVDIICQKEPKDYHPGSKEVVRDIVHPSLYCYVKGVSNVLMSPLSDYGKTKKTSNAPNRKYDFWGRKYEKSDYQWLPAEFVVDESGKVSINSYINNLDRDNYPKAYDLISDIFSYFVPLFESICGCLRNDFYGDEKSDDPISIPLRNRKLQVVTKIVEYRVNQEENFDGVWHVEGMSHENIIATGLCILKRDNNFQGADISFKRYLFEEEAEDLILNTPQNAIRPTEMMDGGDVRPLGTMSTPYGRILVFPNSHIHKLSNMSSSDGNDAIRRILVFWLVNPETPIVSTANVAKQQTTMTFEEAKTYQMALMKERKLHKESFNLRAVCLCEH